jgi:hypothetical protein
LIKLFLIFNFIGVSIFAQSLIGTWTLSNKERPFTFASMVGYEMIFKFHSDGTLEYLKKTTNIMKSTRHYELKSGNKLVVMLKNQNMGVLQNFGLRVFSSQTLTLTPIDKNCYQVYEKQPNENIFKMCKINN